VHEPHITPLSGELPHSASSFVSLSTYLRNAMNETFPMSRSLILSKAQLGNRLILRHVETIKFQPSLSSAHSSSCRITKNVPNNPDKTGLADHHGLPYVARPPPGSQTPPATTTTTTTEIITPFTRQYPALRHRNATALSLGLDRVL